LPAGVQARRQRQTTFWMRERTRARWTLENWISRALTRQVQTRGSRSSRRWRNKPQRLASQSSCPGIALQAWGLIAHPMQNVWARVPARHLRASGCARITLGSVFRGCPRRCARRARIAGQVRRAPQRPLWGMGSAGRDLSKVRVGWTRTALLARSALVRWCANQGSIAWTQNTLASV